MQATSELHDVVSNAIFGQAEHLFDDPTPFDAGDGVFNHNPYASQNLVAELVTAVQFLVAGFFFTCLAKAWAGS
jgi:hypothetical protein